MSQKIIPDYLNDVIALAKQAMLYYGDTTSETHFAALPGVIERVNQILPILEAMKEEAIQLSKKDQPHYWGNS